MGTFVAGTSQIWTLLQHYYMHSLLHLFCSCISYALEPTMSKSCIFHSSKRIHHVPTTLFIVPHFLLFNIYFAAFCLVIEILDHTTIIFVSQYRKVKTTKKDELISVMDKYIDLLEKENGLNLISLDCQDCVTERVACSSCMCCDTWRPNKENLTHPELDIGSVKLWNPTQGSSQTQMLPEAQRRPEYSFCSHAHSPAILPHCHTATLQPRHKFPTHLTLNLSLSAWIQHIPYSYANSSYQSSTKRRQGFPTDLQKFNQ